MPLAFSKTLLSDAAATNAITTETTAAAITWSTTSGFIVIALTDSQLRSARLNHFGIRSAEDQRQGSG